MEFYKNTQNSFLEYIDFAIKKGDSEKGILKNTFQYIFDLDDSEKFCNFYLEDYQHFSGTENDRMQ